MREFVCEHPETGEYILIRKGVQGYIPFPCTDRRAELVNKANGNNIDDLDIAVACSMFGWDIPAADELS